MTTSADRLHDLLRDVQDQVNTSVSAAWGKVLDATPGTAEFARRHAHAVVLLADTARDVDALPASRRDRHSTDLPAWWRAVIGSDQQWNSSLNNPAQSIITTSDLDHLASAGDLIEARLAGTSLAPAAASSEHWLLTWKVGRRCSARATNYLQGSLTTCGPSWTTCRG